MKPTNEKWYSKNKILWRFLLLALIVGVVICLVPLTYFVVRELGHNALYQKTQSASMEIPNENPLDEYDPDAVHYKGEVYHYNEDILTFLVMGIDNQAPNQHLPPEQINHVKGGQADALYLVVANPHTKEVSVIAINRNTMAEVDVYSKDGTYLDTQLAQICVQHAFGSGLEDSCERQVQSVSKLFYKLPISGYAAINMGAFTKINDMIGGVEVELLHKIPAGSSALRQDVGTKVTLKGNDAYTYVRYRDTQAFDSATQRLERQKQYIEAAIPKVIGLVKNDIGFVSELWSTVSDYLVTDISLTQAVYLAGELLEYSFSPDHLYSVPGETVMGENGFEEHYVDDDALYDLVMKVFYEKVQ